MQRIVTRLDDLGRFRRLTLLGKILRELVNETFC